MKKVFILLSTIILLFVCSITNTYAWSVGDIVYIVPDLNDEYTPFGDMTKVSRLDTYETKPMKVLGKNVLETKDYYDTCYDLYSCSKYVDLPVDIIESFRIESQEILSKHFTVYQNYSVTQSEASSTSVGVYSSYTYNNSINLGAIIDIFDLKTTVNNNFAISSDYKNNITISKTQTYNHSITVDYTETYHNNRDTYAYVKRCFRQKCQVLIGYAYKCNYTETKKHTGFLWTETHYSYKLNYYDIIAKNIYLLPVEDAYYHVSYYIDDENGNMKFDSEGHDNIIFM